MSQRQDLAWGAFDAAYQNYRLIGYKLKTPK